MCLLWFGVDVTGACIVTVTVSCVVDGCRPPDRDSGTVVSSDSVRMVCVDVWALACRDVM